MSPHAGLHDSVRAVLGGSVGPPRTVGNRPIRPQLVFNIELLAEVDCELLSNGAGLKIWPAARRKSDDDLDRPIGILLRLRRSGERENSREQSH